MKNKKLTVLGIAAHPDDLDFGASGTFAKWTKEGASCFYLICTNGSKGSDDPKMSPEKLIKLRYKEQIKAGRVLGLKNVYFLDHEDTELFPDLTLKEEIVRHIRLLKPDIVVTFDPAYLYSAARSFINHTDHRAVSLAAMDAVYPLARDRLTFPQHEKQGLYPHKVKLLYFVSFDNYNEIVDVSDFMSLKLKALSKHKSQVDKDALKRIKARASETGKKYGFKFGESFIKIVLP